MAKIDWDNVDYGLIGAKGIAWDTCHKIYVLMDNEQLALMRKYEYEEIRTAEEMSRSELLETLKDWFSRSCPLKFIQAVETNEHDPNAGFTDLIGQFDTDKDECEECYESGCNGECEDEDEDEDED
jgi:hypothetical protein